MGVTIFFIYKKDKSEDGTLYEFKMIHDKFLSKVIYYLINPDFISLSILTFKIIANISNWKKVALIFLTSSIVLPYFFGVP